MPPLEGVEVGEMDESQAVELFFRGGERGRSGISRNVRTGSSYGMKESLSSSAQYLPRAFYCLRLLLPQLQHPHLPQNTMYHVKGFILKSKEHRVTAIDERVGALSLQNDPL
jgi:hypothetical protein